MAETIEAFVARLQKEGVEAGRKEGERHLAQSRRQAEEILAKARAEAGKIRAEAEADAAGRLEKGRTDLQLAARDTVLRLRDALGRAVRGVLAAGVGQRLSDAEFLGQLLRDIILQYVRANLEERVTVRINVAPEMRQQLAQWALAHLKERPDLGNASLDLKGTLAEAGFEYQVNGASVEVTLSSVVEALSELVSPALREIVDQATGQPEPK